MAKLSDKEKMMLACMLAGNDGQSRVEIERPNPDEGVYLVVPDSWALNETVGVVNVVFTVAETMTQGEPPTGCGVLDQQQVGQCEDGPFPPSGPLRLVHEGAARDRHCLRLVQAARGLQGVGDPQDRQRRQRAVLR